MTLGEELKARGFVHQFSTESLGEITDSGKRTVYHGIDPTADSAHAGNFVNWILLRHFVNHGHKVIFLVGGGTGRIGDPKPDAERVLLEEDLIDERVSKLKKQAEHLLGTSDIKFVNNQDWLGQLGFIDFLRDIGKHFTVGELIKKDAIATRLTSDVGLSYTEFAYPILQAYDYLQLHKQFGCDLQIGGSDQWGNIVAGVDLIRRIEQKTVHALTQPLVVDKVSGKKFGKSEGNAIWLDAEKTSPYDFFQFWLNVEDENVIDFLKRFTFLSLEEIGELESRLRNEPEKREAQKQLAHEVTKFVHGDKKVLSVERVAEILFEEEDLNRLQADEYEMLKLNAPYYALSNDISLIDLLTTTGLASSNREARSFIEEGAIRIAGEKYTDANNQPTFNVGDRVYVKRGKKRVMVVEFTD